MASDRDANRLRANLASSVTSARALSGAFTAANRGADGLASGVAKAANAASELTQNMAAFARTARGAAIATGVGAVVAAIGLAVAATINWKQQTKEVAERIRNVNAAAAVLQAQAKGDKRAETELQIADAMAGELFQAKQLESIFRKFPALQDAIRAKAEAARRAAAADVNRAFDEQRFQLRQQTAQTVAERDSEFDRLSRAAAAEREKALRDLELNEKGLGSEQIARIREDIELQFREAVATIEYETFRPFAEQLGLSFAQSISDGISRAIQSGNIADGFRTLTGGILIGFGNMLQNIGEQGLLASKLIGALVKAISSLDPGAGIAASLGLIAVGGLLKGAGAALGGRSSHGPAVTPYTAPVIYSLNPAVAGAPSTAGLAPAQPITVGNLVLLSPKDPTWQRQLQESIKFAGVRGDV